MVKAGRSEQCDGNQPPQESTGRDQMAIWLSGLDMAQQWLEFRFCSNVGWCKQLAAWKSKVSYFIIIVWQEMQSFLDSSTLSTQQYACCAFRRKIVQRLPLSKKTFRRRRLTEDSNSTAVRRAYQVE